MDAPPSCGMSDARASGAEATAARAARGSLAKLNSGGRTGFVVAGDALAIGGKTGCATAGFEF